MPTRLAPEVIDAEDSVELATCDKCGEQFDESEEGCRLTGPHYYYDNRVRGYVNNPLYCGSCYDTYVTSCEGCSAEYDSDHADNYYVDGYGDYCQSCYESGLFRWCEGCNAYVTEDDDCGCGSSDLYGYDYKTRAVFHGKPKDKAFFGLELEMERCGNYSISDGVDKIRSAFGEDRFYCKHDGSLNNGIEMVSHPMSLDEWHKIEPEFRTMLDGLRRMGYRSWDADSAGIHVHLSADAFDNDGSHLWKFQSLFYGNQVQMEKFAGRSSHWGKLDVSKGYITEACKIRKRGGYTDRYMAVNLCNRFTVEMRLFRGSLNTDRVLANIELIHAALTYTRTLTSKDVSRGALKFDVFAYWLSAKPEYQHAAALIVSRRIQGMDPNS